jgi:hypothetical protein
MKHPGSILALVALYLWLTGPSNAMIVEVHINHETPPSWEAIMTGALVDFRHRDGTGSTDSNQNVNLPSGAGEELLHSADVDCVTSFRVALAVRDRKNLELPFLIVRTFKDPNGNECIQENQTVTLGEALVDFELLGVPDDTEVYELDFAEE